MSSAISFRAPTQDELRATHKHLPVNGDHLLATDYSYLIVGKYIEIYWDGDKVFTTSPK